MTSELESDYKELYKSIIEEASPEALKKLKRDNLEIKDVRDLQWDGRFLWQFCISENKDNLFKYLGDTDGYPAPGTVNKIGSNGLKEFNLELLIKATILVRGYKSKVDFLDNYVIFCLKNKPLKQAKILAEYKVLVDKIIKGQQEKTKNNKEVEPDAFAQPAIPNVRARKGDDKKEASKHLQTLSQPSLSYQVKLTPPPVYKGNINYFGTQAINIYGRDKEKEKLKAFLNSDKHISWYQIAGVAGQGKSRLALYLTQYAENKRWKAGFLEDSDFEEFSKNWRDWNPQKPHLFVFDYVIGREQKIYSFFKELYIRENLNTDIRILLVERQPWNKGGFQRPKYQKQQRNHNDQSVLELSQLLERENPSEWFQKLCTDKKSNTSTRIEAYLNNTQFENGVLELEKIKKDKDLFSIINKVIESEGKKSLGQDRKTEVIEQLEHIDYERRPLYAYFLGQTLADNNNTTIKTREELLKNVLNHQRTKRWKSFFSNEPVIWSDDNPAYQLAVLATITKGIDCKEIADKGLFEMQSPDIRHKAMTLTDTPVISKDDPGHILLPLQPDLLGEWMVLDSFNNHLSANQLMDLAWKCNPKETAAFLLRLVQDFFDHTATKMILEFQPPDKESFLSLSKEVTSIFENLINHNNNQIDLEVLVKALKYRATKDSDPSAMNMLAHCYKNGFGVKKFNFMANRWFRRSANKGNSLAMFEVGMSYRYGLRYGYSVLKNRKKSIKWFFKAANEGELNAAFHLGISYLEGIEIKQNYREATKYFYIASNKGHATSMLYLGLLLLEGIGIDKNDDEAIKFLIKAANENSDINEQYYFIPYDKENKKEWLPDITDQHYAHIMNQLGKYYTSGHLFIGQNQERAIECYKKSAAKGSYDAMVSLGFRCLFGADNQPDFEMAKTCFQKPADDSNVVAMLGLAWSCLLGIDKDIKKAMLYFNKAMDKKSAAAVRGLTWLYKYGDVNQNSEYINILNKRIPQQYLVPTVEKIFCNLATILPLVIPHTKNAQISNWIQKQINLSNKKWVDVSPISGGWETVPISASRHVLKHIEQFLSYFEPSIDIDTITCESIRYCPLTFCNNIRLFDFQFRFLDTNEILLSSAIANDNGVFFLNEDQFTFKVVAHWLFSFSCQSALIQYVKFFCYFSRKKGTNPSHIISDINEIPLIGGSSKSRLYNKLKKKITRVNSNLNLYKKNDSQYIEMVVLKDATISIVEFEINAYGSIFEKEKKIIASKLPILERNYNGIFRSPLNQI